MKTHPPFSQLQRGRLERTRRGQAPRNPAPGSGKTHPVSMTRLGGIRHCRHR